MNGTELSCNLPSLIAESPDLP